MAARAASLILLATSGGTALALLLSNNFVVVRALAWLMVVTALLCALGLLVSTGSIDELPRPKPGDWVRTTRSVPFGTDLPDSMTQVSGMMVADHGNGTITVHCRDIRGDGQWHYDSTGIGPREALVVPDGALSPGDREWLIHERQKLPVREVHP